MGPTVSQRPDGEFVYDLNGTWQGDFYGSNPHCPGYRHGPDATAGTFGVTRADDTYHHGREREPELRRGLRRPQVALVYETAHSGEIGLRAAPFFVRSGSRCQIMSLGRQALVTQPISRCIPPASFISLRRRALV